MQSTLVASQKKADLAPQFHAVGDSMRGLIWPVMRPQATYDARPRTIEYERKRAEGSSPAMV
jgi:hypothetical protein